MKSLIIIAIIAAVCSILLVAVALILLIPSPVPNPTYPPCTWVVCPTCENTETGWMCNFTDEVIPQGLSKDEATEEYRQECEDTGGRWACHGYCMLEDEHYCDFPFDDAGRECTDSLQCKGKCVADPDYVTLMKLAYPDRAPGEDIDCGGMCTGRCAEYSFVFCDDRDEVTNGKIEDSLLRTMCN